MFTSFTGKENILIGKPHVKEGDVDRVKRNLSTPLQTRNKLENNNNTTNTAFIGSARTCVNSPVTELAHDFTELAAHETCNNTPKRRLSLNSSTGSPTPELLRVQVDDTSSKCNVSYSSDDPGASASKSTCNKIRNALELRNQLGKSSFRRCKSMPFGNSPQTEASPLLSLPGTASPLVLPQQQTLETSTSFYVGSDEASRDSQDSGIDKDEDFCYSQEDGKAEFVAPAVPPERTQACNEQSPPEKQRRSVFGSPYTFDNFTKDCSDSPLNSHQLCSQTEDDDGFSDLDYLEKQVANSAEVPPSIAGMLTGKILASSQPPPPTKAKPPTITSFRNNLFRSPSMPQQLSDSDSYDIRRRVLCGSKRSEPPNDGTPGAVSKKRRGVISSGNLRRELPQQDSVCANRLLRCRSMVEQSVSFHQSKGESDGLTGDGRKCCLPLTKGKNTDLNNISHETMSRLLRGDFNDEMSDFTIIDCRYPYEYNGGHIKGAVNLYTRENIHDKYLDEATERNKRSDGDKRSILIFHCEFSSERAPRLSRFLRNLDRDKNIDCYPSLFHPELYLLEGGYKAFYENHEDLCEPAGYIPMLHRQFSEDLKKFRAKSKSWAGDEKRGGFRTGMASKRL